MAKKFNKEELFENFFNTTVQAITTFETTFGIDEVWPKIFGVDASNQYEFTNAEMEQKADDAILDARPKPAQTGQDEENQPSLF